MRGVRAVLCVLGGAVLAGCFSPTTRTCSDGTQCPATEACAPAGGGCVDPTLIAACDGLGENANCVAGAVVGGVCQQGVCTATAWDAVVLVGSNGAGAVSLSEPSGTAVDRRGDLFVADADHHRVVELDVSGVVTTIAGTGVGGFSGDGGEATAAQLATPQDVAVDGLGNVYIADEGNQRIRRVDAGGVITTIAGTGPAGSFGDNGPAILAELHNPTSVAVDGRGDVFVADTGNNSIREIDASGTITTVAGGDNTLSQPEGVAVDGDELVIADSGHNQIDRLDGIRQLTVIANMSGLQGFSGDGGSALGAELADPFGVAVGSNGDIFVADRSNNRIRRISKGMITTVVGDGKAAYSGDGGPATSAEIFDPYDVAVDATGTLYVADFENQRVRAVDAGGAITTAIGTGFPVATGDGGAATCATLQNPSGLGLDGSNTLYIAETTSGRVRRVDALGVITTVAGDGLQGNGGDGSAAIDAEVAPNSVAFDAPGNMYVTDDDRIRRVDPAGTITTVAGGQRTGRGDGGPATEAQLQFVRDVATDASGDLFIADASDARIRKVDTGGIITTVAGGGSGGGTGDGGPASQATLSSPSGVAVDSDGSLYIADEAANRIRRVDPLGIITTVAGTGVSGFSGDGGAATAAELNEPTNVAIDAQHRLFISDAGNDVVRRVDAAGTITTVAGQPGGQGSDGDGGSATRARLNDPVYVKVDAAGTLYIDDLGNERIRRVDPTGTITTVAGAIDPGQMGPVSQALLADPRAIALTPDAMLFAGGASGTVQQLTATSLSTIAGRYPQFGPTGALARFQDGTFGVISGIANDAPDGLVFVTESTATPPDEGDAVRAITVAADPDQSTITTVGNNISGGGPAATSPFRAPTGLYFDADARVLYIADTGNEAIRAIDVSAGIGSATPTTIAGTDQTFGFFGDGGPATDALLFAPQAITRCGNGDLFIADTGNNRVRRVAAGTGVISTVLGDGSVSSSGEGSPASTFPVDAPLGLACDDVGNLFVTSTSTVRMVLAGTDGVVDGTGPVRTIYGLPPRDTFPQSLTRCLSGLVVVDATTVRVTDTCTGLLVELRRVSGA